MPLIKVRRTFIFLGFFRPVRTLISYTFWEFVNFDVLSLPDFIRTQEYFFIFIVLALFSGYCGYNMFEFSKDKSFYTMSCQGPHVPQDYLYRTSPNEKVGTLVTNEALSEELSLKNLPKISNFDVDIDNGNYKAKVRLYLPHDFDENKKYPMLVNVYAGPNSQQVSDRFKLGTYA